MAQNPLITVVVPVYKVPEEMLRKCLDSLCAQTCMNFEALLVDDGSPDNCGAICDEYARKNPFMRVIHQENGGLSVVRNVGIDRAAGDWVCFVDGDDWIEPETVQFATEYAAKYPQADVLIWDEFYDIDGVSVPNRFFGQAADETMVFRGEETERLIEMILPEKCADAKTGNLVDIGTANARLYNVGFLRSNRLYNKPGLKRSQDNVFNLWVFEKADFVCYTRKNLYHYTYNEEAATKKYSPDIADTMQLLYESIMEYVETSGKGEKYRPRVYLRFIRIIARLFELNYANPQNKKAWLERLREARRDMQRPCYQEIIENCDTKEQSAKIRLIHALLKRRMYGVLCIITRINAATRKKRLASRKKG